MKYSVFLAAFLFSHLAFAAPDSCSTINLTSTSQIYHGIPTYDQGGGQICFSYTAAQLIEGQRVIAGHRYERGEAINPLSMALSLAIKNGQRDLQQGGVACEAVNHARTTPICPEAKSYSDAGQIEQHISDFKFCHKNASTERCEKLLELFRLDKKIFAQDNPLNYVKAIEDTKCSSADKIVLKIPECKYDNDEAKSSAFFRKAVDNVFDSKTPRPVEIGYSMNILSYSGNEKKSYIIERKTEPDVINFSLRYKPHSSILLGRKMGKNGQCQYLLRNTQGKEFCPIGIVAKRGWECDSKSEGIWINANEIFDSTFQISKISE